MKGSVRVIIATFLLLVFGQQVFASHALGKDLQYECLGVVGSNVQYKVTVHYYRNCWDNSYGGQSSTAPSSVTLHIKGTPCNYSLDSSLPPDTSAVPANGTEITPLCPSQLPNSGCNWSQTGLNPPYPGAQVYTYTGIVSVPVTCTQVTFGTDECCRNSSITNIPNASSDDLSVMATVNNVIDTSLGITNNSVAFTNQPVSFFCLGSNVTFNHGAVDPDGDSLVYSLVYPMYGASLPYSNLTFNTGYSVTQPVRTIPQNSFQFNTHTGQMQFVPAYQENDVLAMRVDEYRNGVWVGATMRDFQIVILNCAVSVPRLSSVTNIQNGNFIDSVTVQTCQGNSVQFDIPCVDAGHGITTTSNISATPSAISGATITQVGSGDSVIVHVQWTPQAADSGCHYFLLTALNDDCPITGSVSRQFSICVANHVQLLFSSGVTYCGTPIQLTATGGTNFSWSPSTGQNAVSDSNSLSPTVTPVSPTTYHFHSDCGSDSVFINVSTPFQVNVGNDTLLCSSSHIQLEAEVTNAIGNVNYKWTADGGIFSNDSISNPLATLTNSAIFYCRVTDSVGCVQTDSLNVSATPYALAHAAATLPTLCNVAPVMLYPVINYPDQFCGINNSPCSGTSFATQIGNGTTMMGSPIQYPTIYGNVQQGVRTQFLYKRDDLLQMLGGAGQISQLGFQIAQFNSNAFIENFEIRLGCTDVNSLTSWQPNTTLVYQRASYTPVPSWNYHTLDSIYNWDGNSNLVVEVCSYNAYTYGNQNNMMKGRAVNYAATYYSHGTTPQCGYTNTPQSSTNLPNMKIEFCQKPLEHASISWSSVSHPNVVIDSLTPTVSPSTTDTYYFSIFDSICNSTIRDSVVVLISTASYHNTITAAICQGESYAFNGQNYTQNGTYTQHLTTVNGCDSNTILQLTVYPKYSQSVNAYICTGTSYHFGGQTLTASGVYRDTLQTVYGCDSVVTLTLSVGSVLNVGLSAVICLGSTFNFNGQHISVAGNYIDTLIASGGCDSIVFLTLSMAPILTTQISEIICEGSTYNFNGRNLSANGIYTDTIVSSRGCDSIITLTLFVNPAPVVSLSGIPDTSCYEDYAIPLASHGSPWGGYFEVDGNLNSYFSPHNLGVGSHTVTYIYVNANNCSDTTTQEVTVIECNSTGINDVVDDYKLFVYPNPASEELNIALGNRQADEVSIYNAEGVLVNKIIQPQHNRIDIRALANGVYLIAVQQKEKLLRARWVKM